MHNHVDHRWIKTFLRKTTSILLVYSLFFINTANAAVGGWELKNPVAQGASTVYDATKNALINGKKFIKESSVKITPTATSVAKVLARGGAGYALSVAVEQLLGSVDWVLDPANNRIVYYDLADASFDKNCTSTVRYISSQQTSTQDTIFCSRDAAAQKALNDANMGSGVYLAGTYSNQGSGTGFKKYGASVLKDGKPYHTVYIYEYAAINQPIAEPEEQYLPLPVVAERVISNAESGDSSAQAATTSAAADIVAEAENDDAKARPIASQAEANAETKPADEDAAANANTGTATATPQADPVTGEQAPPTDISLEFPVFCNWAPTICEAAQTVISFPQTLTNWWETGKSKAEEWATSISEAWTDAKEWAKNDENDDTDNEPDEIQEIDIGALDTSTFQGVAGCPAPIQVPISFGTGGETQISYEPICQLADKWSFVAPLIGFLSGAMILVGVGRKGEDGEI